MKSTIIYWSCIEDEWLRAKEPEPIYKNFIKNIKDKTTEVELCPSIKDYTRNTFSIKSIYDYSFEIGKDNNVFSAQYDQKFFDRHVLVRSNIDKCFSFSQNFIFFTEDKSLNMSAGVFPYLEDNNITKACTIIPGKVDIGKWFRPSDFAFYLKSNHNNFKIEEDEIYQYVKFDTENKIIFKQFRTSENIKQYVSDITNSKNFRKTKNRQIENYYNMFNHKKHIIKEIKNNLV